jgi:hypothetical protein
MVLLFYASPVEMGEIDYVFVKSANPLPVERGRDPLSLATPAVDHSSDEDRPQSVASDSDPFLGPKN